MDFKAEAVARANRRIAEAGMVGVMAAQRNIDDITVEEAFDLVLAFHVCGGATDVGIDCALAMGAAIVLCPCEWPVVQDSREIIRPHSLTYCLSGCVGKLKVVAIGVHFYSILRPESQFTESVIHRPRSQWLRAAGVQSEPFVHVIARLGDHAENEHSEAKLLIEYDRCAYIHERNAEYQVERAAMCRCVVLFADLNVMCSCS